MNWDDGGVPGEQIRYPRSRTWLQLYVDMFATACPQSCRGLSLVVVPDPSRRNGCNWNLAVNVQEKRTAQGARCLRQIDDELRLLFSIFDMEMEGAAGSGGCSLRLHRS